MNHQTNREDCYFCGDKAAGLLETHHIVPRRHGGSDDPKNLVDVCPNCHRKLEHLYGKQFYRNVTDVSLEGGERESEDAEESYEDIIPDGQSWSQTSRARDLKEIIESLDEENGRDGAPIKDIHRVMVSHGYEPEYVMKDIDLIMRKGMAYQVTGGHLRAA